MADFYDPASPTEDDLAGGMASNDSSAAKDAAECGSLIEEDMDVPQTHTALHDVSKTASTDLPDVCDNPSGILLSTPETSTSTSIPGPDVAVEFPVIDLDTVPLPPSPPHSSVLQPSSPPSPPVTRRGKKKKKNKRKEEEPPPPPPPPPKRRSKKRSSQASKEGFHYKSLVPEEPPPPPPPPPDPPQPETESSVKAEEQSPAQKLISKAISSASTGENKTSMETSTVQMPLKQTGLKGKVCFQIKSFKKPIVPIAGDEIADDANDNDNESATAEVPVQSKSAFNLDIFEDTQDKEEESSEVIPVRFKVLKKVDMFKPGVKEETQNDDGKTSAMSSAPHHTALEAKEIALKYKEVLEKTLLQGSATSLPQSGDDAEKGGMGSDCNKATMDSEFGCNVSLGQSVDGAARKESFSDLKKSSHSTDDRSPDRRSGRRRGSLSEERDRKRSPLRDRVRQRSPDKDRHRRKESSPRRERSKSPKRERTRSPKSNKRERSRTPDRVHSRRSRASRDRSRSRSVDRVRSRRSKKSLERDRSQSPGVRISSRRRSRSPVRSRSRRGRSPPYRNRSRSRSPYRAYPRRRGKSCSRSRSGSRSTTPAKNYPAKGRRSPLRRRSRTPNRRKSRTPEPRPGSPDRRKSPERKQSRTPDRPMSVSAEIQKSLSPDRCEFKTLDETSVKTENISQVENKDICEEVTEKDNFEIVSVVKSEHVSKEMEAKSIAPAFKTEQDELVSQSCYSSASERPMFKEKEAPDDTISMAEYKEKELTTASKGEDTVLKQDNVENITSEHIMSKDVKVNSSSVIDKDHSKLDTVEVNKSEEDASLASVKARLSELWSLPLEPVIPIKENIAKMKLKSFDKDKATKSGKGKKMYDDRNEEKEFDEKLKGKTTSKQHHDETQKCEMLTEPHSSMPRDGNEKKSVDYSHFHESDLLAEVYRKSKVRKTSISESEEVDEGETLDEHRRPVRESGKRRKISVDREGDKKQNKLPLLDSPQPVDVVVYLQYEKSKWDDTDNSELIDSGGVEYSSRSEDRLSQCGHADEKSYSKRHSREDGSLSQCDHGDERSYSKRHSREDGSLSQCDHGDEKSYSKRHSREDGSLSQCDQADDKSYSKRHSREDGSGQEKRSTYRRQEEQGHHDRSGHHDRGHRSRGRHSHEDVYSKPVSLSAKPGKSDVSGGVKQGVEKEQEKAEDGSAKVVVPGGFSCIMSAYGSDSSDEANPSPLGSEKLDVKKTSDDSKIENSKIGICEQKNASTKVDVFECSERPVKLDKTQCKSQNAQVSDSFDHRDRNNSSRDQYDCSDSIFSQPQFDVTVSACVKVASADSSDTVQSIPLSLSSSADLTQKLQVGDHSSGKTQDGLTADELDITLEIPLPSSPPPPPPPPSSSMPPSVLPTSLPPLPATPSSSMPPSVLPTSLPLLPPSSSMPPSVLPTSLPPLPPLPSSSVPPSVPPSVLPTSLPPLPPLPSSSMPPSVLPTSLPPLPSPPSSPPPPPPSLPPPRPPSPSSPPPPPSLPPLPPSPPSVPQQTKNIAAFSCNTTQMYTDEELRKSVNDALYTHGQIPLPSQSVASTERDSSDSVSSSTVVESIRAPVFQSGKNASAGNDRVADSADSDSLFSPVVTSSVDEAESMPGSHAPVQVRSITISPAVLKFKCPDVSSLQENHSDADQRYPDTLESAHTSVKNASVCGDVIKREKEITIRLNHDTDAETKVDISDGLRTTKCDSRSEAIKPSSDSFESMQFDHGEQLEVPAWDVVEQPSVGRSPSDFDLSQDKLPHVSRDCAMKPGVDDRNDYEISESLDKEQDAQEPEPSVIYVEVAVDKNVASFEDKESGDEVTRGGDKADSSPGAGESAANAGSPAKGAVTRSRGRRSTPSKSDSPVVSESSDASAGSPSHQPRRSGRLQKKQELNPLKVDVPKKVPEKKGKKDKKFQPLDTSSQSDDQSPVSNLKGDNSSTKMFIKTFDEVSSEEISSVASVEKSVDSSIESSEAALADAKERTKTVVVFKTKAKTRLQPVINIQKIEVVGAGSTLFGDKPKPSFSSDANELEETDTASSQKSTFDEEPQKIPTIEQLDIQNELAVKEDDEKTDFLSKVLEEKRKMDVRLEERKKAEMKEKRLREARDEKDQRDQADREVRDRERRERDRERRERDEKDRRERSHKRYSDDSDDDDRHHRSRGRRRRDRDRDRDRDDKRRDEHRSRDRDDRDRSYRDSRSRRRYDRRDSRSPDYRRDSRSPDYRSKSRSDKKSDGSSKSSKTQMSSGQSEKDSSPQRSSKSDSGHSPVRPEKVKSRWRRASEAEQKSELSDGANSESVSVPIPKTDVTQYASTEPMTTSASQIPFQPDVLQAAVHGQQMYSHTVPPFGQPGVHGIPANYQQGPHEYDANLQGYEGHLQGHPSGYEVHPQSMHQPLVQSVGHPGFQHCPQYQQAPFHQGQPSFQHPQVYDHVSAAYPQEAHQEGYPSYDYQQYPQTVPPVPQYPSAEYQSNQPFISQGNNQMHQPPFQPVNYVKPVTHGAPCPAPSNGVDPRRMPPVSVPCSVPISVLATGTSSAGTDTQSSGRVLVPVPVTSVQSESKKFSAKLFWKSSKLTPLTKPADTFQSSTQSGEQNKDVSVPKSGPCPTTSTESTPQADTSVTSVSADSKPSPAVQKPVTEDPWDPNFDLVVPPKVVDPEPERPAAQKRLSSDSGIIVPPKKQKYKILDYTQADTTSQEMEKTVEKGEESVKAAAKLGESSDTKENVKPKSEEEENQSDQPYFEDISENIYLCERRKSKQMKRMVCDCTTSKEDRESGIVACGDDCLNKMLLIECGSRCPCGEYCQNKRFVKREYSSVSPFSAGSKGWGLTADVELKSGQFVMEYVGEVLDFREFKNRTKQYAKMNIVHHYFMALTADEVIDATMKGNISRFINHSCDPNCETQKWTVNGELRIGFFVRRNILPGDELTFNYQFEHYGENAQKCYCGSENCRGFIGTAKTVPLRKKKDKILKKSELFEDEMLEEEIEEMTALEGLRKKDHVLNLCRLMVRAVRVDHRLELLRILQETPEPACLRFFLDYHGLPLLWSWLADQAKEMSKLKLKILQTLKLLPIKSRTVLVESKILPIIQQLSEPETEVDLNFDPLPVVSNQTPVSILAIHRLKDRAAFKKRVTFADEATSSDSDLSDSSKITNIPQADIEVKPSVVETKESDNTEQKQVVDEPKQSEDEVKTNDTDEKKDEKKDDLELKQEVLKPCDIKTEPDTDGSDNAMTDKVDRDCGDVITASETPSETPSEQAGKNDDSSLDESAMGDNSLSEVEGGNSEVTSPNAAADTNAVEGSVDVKQEVEVTVKEEMETDAKEDKDVTDCKEVSISIKEEVAALAKELLELWKDLKDYKIPKKERMEELKKTEEELNTRSRLPDIKGYKERFKDRIKRKIVPVASKSRKPLLPTPDAMTKVERRQLFEAQVRAQDEMNAEIQRQHDEYVKQMYEQDPNYQPQFDPNLAQFMQQEQDPNQLVDPSLQYADPNTYVDPNTGYVDPNAAYVDPNTGFVDPNAGFVDPNAGFVDPNAAYVDPNIQYVDPSTGYVDPNSGYVDPNAQFVDPNTGFIDPNAAYTQGSQFVGMEAGVAADPAFPGQQGGVEVQHPAFTDPAQQAAYQQYQIPAHVQQSSVLAVQQAGAAQVVGSIPATVVQTPGRAQPPVSTVTHVLPGVTDSQAVLPAVQAVAAAVADPNDQRANLMVAQVQQLHQLLALQQNLATLEASPTTAVTQSQGEEDVPPPPSVPKLKLPPKWKSAKDAEGRTYYYHSVTKVTQWEIPTWDQSEDMDLSTPEYKVKSKKKSKTTTAAADTSSDTKKLKDQFRHEMSAFVVTCLNPFRKPDCVNGRICSTEDFKHLARKLTHHVMAKELKHCRHVEDLEVNESVKAKAKDYVKKYMSKFTGKYQKDDDDF